MPFLHRCYQLATQKSAERNKIQVFAFSFAGIPLLSLSRDSGRNDVIKPPPSPASSSHRNKKELNILSLQKHELNHWE